MEPRNTPRNPRTRRWRRPLALAALLTTGCGEDPLDTPDAPPLLPFQGDELTIGYGAETLAPDDPQVVSVREAARGANVLILTLDTVRADALGCYGNRPSPSPTLDRIAAEGVQFRRTLTPSPVTLPSHAAMMTGKVPSEHGALENGAFELHSSFDTLPELLSDAGRATAAFVSSHVLSRRYGLAQGFDHYDDRLDSSDHSPAVERSARNTVDAMVEWLADPPPEPWFVWGHFYDAHYPWEPPEGYREGWTPYEGEIAALDAQLARLLRAFDQDGRLDRTVLIITSDHGEGLGEHGEETHGMQLYDTTLEVPLLVRFPPLGHGQMVEGQVVLTDLYPTVLDLLSQPFEENLAAVSLLPTILSPDPEIWQDAFVETALPQFSFSAAAIDALVTRRFKYVRSPRAELYDRDQDPDEGNNLLGSMPDLEADYRGRVTRLQIELASRAPDASRDLSPEELLLLERLGYRVGGSIEVRYEGMDPKDALALSHLQAQAQGAISRGDLPMALRLFDRSLAELPDDPSALAGKASVLMAMKQDAPACEALERCLELRSDFFFASLMLAQIERRQQHFDQVLKHCEHALLHNPALVEGYLMASEACFRLGRHDDAREWLEKTEGNTLPTPEQRETIQQRLASLLRRP